MANTIDFILTNSASELISKVLSGKTLNFTRMAVGDGFSYDTTVAKGYTTLVNEMLSIDITKKETLTPSSVKVTSAFKNTDAQKEFYYREVGLYAQDPDTGNEVLYAYGNRNDAAELITPTGSNVITKQLAFIISVGNSANVTFNVNAGVYALQEDMLDVHANITNITTKITELNSTKANQSDLDVERARITNLATLAEGSTTGDAELIDVRTDDLGVTHSSAGEAFRVRTNQLQIDVDELVGELDYLNTNPTILMKNGYYTTSGTLEYYEKYSHSDLIRCKRGASITISGQVNVGDGSASVAIAFFDVKGIFYSYEMTANATIVINDESIHYFSVCNYISTPPTITINYSTHLDKIDDDLNIIHSNISELSDNIYSVTGELVNVINNELSIATTYSATYIETDGKIITNETMTDFYVKTYALEANKTYVIKGHSNLRANGYPIVSFGNSNAIGTKTSILLAGSTTLTDYYLEYKPMVNGFIYIAYVNEHRLNVYDTIKQNKFEIWKNNVNEKLNSGYFENKIIYALGDSITYLGGSWAYQLASKLGAKKVINISRGSARWGDRGNNQIDYDTNSPLYSLGIAASISTDGKTVWFDGNSGLTNGNLPTDNSSYTTISNEIRFMQRLTTTEGYESPNIIIIACGVNDTEASTILYTEDNFNDVFNTTFENMTTTNRSNLGGGLRWCIEKLRSLYPNAQVIVATPIQSAYAYLRPYLPNTCKWIKAMADYYSIHVIDAYTECGITKAFEKGWNDTVYISSNSGRYLYDGLHPNNAGNILMGNYFAQELKSHCHDGF